MLSRILSLAVAITYVILACIFTSNLMVLRLVMFLVMPLACIWFSEEMGNLPAAFGKGNITTPTPPWLVAAGGWALLILPAVMALIIRIRLNN